MKQVAKIAASALLFGTVAGASMVGVNVAADRLGVNNKTVVESTADGAFQSNPENTEAATEAAGQQSTEAARPAAEDSSTVREVAKNAMPSVVAITNMVKYRQNGFSIFGNYQSQETEVPASGSGVIIGKTDTELLIVTNNHVVRDSSSLSVSFIDGKSVDAAIKGTDSSADLAVVTVKLSDIESTTMDAIKVIEIGDSDKTEVGDQVVAIGNALGYGQSVTTGIISAKDRTVKTNTGTETGLLQTDAAINPGNSGGALLNMQGELIGINVAKNVSTMVEGMSYSIPSAKAKAVIADLSALVTREEVPENERGFLGIQVKTIDKTTAESFGMPQGVFIYKFTDGASAQNSGLQEKDIITKLEGQSVTNYDELRGVLAKYRVGEKVKVTVQRQDGSGKYVETEVEVVLGEDGTSNSASGSGSSQDPFRRNDGSQGGSQDPFQRKDNSQNGQNPDSQKTPEEGASPQTPNNGNSQTPSQDEIIEEFRKFFNQYQR